MPSLRRKARCLARPERPPQLYAGVKAASFSLLASLMQNGSSSFFWLDGQPQNPRPLARCIGRWLYAVEPGYLTVMGIPQQGTALFTARMRPGLKEFAVIDETLPANISQTPAPWASASI